MRMKTRFTSLICCLATALMIAGSTATANDVIPLIQMDGVPLPEAINNLARQAEFNLILDPHITRYGGIGRKNITGTWTNITAMAALKVLLTEYKLTMVTNPATTVARIAPANLNVQPVSASLVGTNAGKVIPLIVMDYVPLTEAIRKIGKEAGLKMTFDPAITKPGFGGEDTVSVRWTDLTALQALAAVLDNYGLTMTEDAATSTAHVSLQK